jgi:tellurite resistance protein
MSDEFLGSRRKALEESFFAKHNEKLRRALKEKESAKTKKEALSAASGISDDAVLEELVRQDIDSDTVAALALVPLVEVAWADGNIDDKERTAVLSAAEQAGLSRESAAFQLLEGWLAVQPGRRVMAAWKDYVGSLANTLSPQAKATLRQDLLGRARAVAKAAGGFLGLGSKVSRSEQAVLDELEQAFS